MNSNQASQQNVMILASTCRDVGYSKIFYDFPTTDFLELGLLGIQATFDMSHFHCDMSMVDLRRGSVGSQVSFFGLSNYPFWANLKP